MKQYQVIENGMYLGVNCTVGDIVTVKNNNSWSISSHPHCTFVGNIVKHWQILMPLGEDFLYKTPLEIKINLMWNRQPYMQKKLGIEKKEAFDYYRGEISGAFQDEYLEEDESEYDTY